MKTNAKMRSWVIPAVLVAAVGGVRARGAATPAEPGSSDAVESPQQMAKEIRELRQEVAELRQEIHHPATNQANETAATQTPTENTENTSIPSPHAPIHPNNPNSIENVSSNENNELAPPPAKPPLIGYKNGIVIETPDNDFSLKVNGFTQVRYTFADSSLQDASEFAGSLPKHGDTSGFDLRFARIYFSGHAFSPNLTYMISGDFAGDSGSANDLQLLDDYIAWRFNDTFNVRAGSFLVPYSRVEYFTPGEGLVDFPAVEVPFDPARAFGISLYGQPIKNKLTYEFNINNGPNGNHSGRTAQIGGDFDNRLGFATRWQIFGGTGTPEEFSTESDLRKDKSTVAWMLAAAAGYDSLNQASDAFPGRQVYSIPGVPSMTNPGFVTYPVNGDIYRATVDGEIKYNGWEFMGATYFQQINATPTTGVTLPPGYDDKTSFYNIAYYGQVGYMFLPKWEIVGRAGQYYTEGASRHMDEFTLGLNYFIFGENAKLQGDVTYIPDAAFSSSTDGTAQSTRDFITRIQMQLKF